MAIRIAHWDCRVCGTKGNLGPETRCKNCGSSRPSDVKFYLPTNAEIVRERERIEEAKAGPDWICGHCTTQNKFRATTCAGCANPKDELSQDVNLQTRTYQTREVPREGMRKEDEAGERYRRAHWEKTRPKESKLKSVTKLSFLGLVALVIAGLIFIYGFPKTIQVKVDSFSWERKIQFAKYEAVAEEAWKLPQGALMFQAQERSIIMTRCWNAMKQGPGR